MNVSVNNDAKTWLPILITFLAGAIATALVPQTVPILGAIADEFNVERAHLGWLVSFPTLACALGALAFGVVVDRVGDVRILLIGMVLVIVGDAGVSLAPGLQWLFAARLFQGFGYLCITVAAPTFIQRITAGDTRRAAMAFWAAHTPAGFAAAMYFAAQLLASEISWRWSFLGHALAAVVVGIAALTLRSAASVAKVSRSTGAKQVLTSRRAYAVGIGAGGTAMLQVGVMTLLPSILSQKLGLSGPQAALVIVFAMLVNWGGAMLIVLTRLRNMPSVVLPVASFAAALFGFAIVAAPAANSTAAISVVMLFTATVGIANALVWSLLPAAVPSHEAAGATAGLITQGSFIGVLIGIPTFFWMQHGNDPVIIGGICALLTVVMLVALLATTSGRDESGAKALRPAAH